MLKRSKQKGGFCQPITGNVALGESFEAAAVRELGEETGITKIEKFIDIDYLFEFSDANRRQVEKVFGIKVKQGTEINLSNEHTEFRWVAGDDCIDYYLKYPGNKEGLRKLMEKLRVYKSINDVF